MDVGPEQSPSTARLPVDPDSFRLRPSLGELTVMGRRVVGTVVPSGRVRDAHRWAEQGLSPTQRHLRQAASGFTDELFLNVIRAMSSKVAVREMDRVLEETFAALDIYRSRGWLDPGVLHQNPEAMDATSTEITVRGHHWRRLEDRRPWEPLAESPGAERWLSYPGGSRAVAHVRMHREPRPWLVMVHGAYMGDVKIDTRIFNVEDLFHRLGFNIALPSLPLHGSRKAKGTLSKSLPSLDTMDNIHGITQAVHEVRSLLGWIRREQPGQRLGIYGVSLGGYVTSLVAGLEEPLDVLVAGVPAVDFQAVFLAQTPPSVRLTDWFRAFHAATVELNRPLSPLAVTPATPVESRYLYAARGDRVLPPATQALRLWEHWGRPESYWFDGGHVLQVRNAGIRKFVARVTARHLLADDVVVDGNARGPRTPRTPRTRSRSTGR